jgi:type I restriction-modification system DNA methylase subunit
VFWVPKEARWSFLQANAKQPTIGKLLDEAMDAIEKENSSLKGVLPKDYNKPALDKQLLGEIIDLMCKSYRTSRQRFKSSFPRNEGILRTYPLNPPLNWGTL